MYIIVTLLRTRNKVLSDLATTGFDEHYEGRAQNTRQMKHFNESAIVLQRNFSFCFAKKVY